MPERLIRKLEQRDRLTEEEKDALRALSVVELQFAARQDVVHFGDTPSHSNLLIEGFACRYRDLSDGERQILSVHVPGDFVDLQSLLLKVMDHSIAALGPCRILSVPHAALRQVSETQPHLTRLLWLSTLVDSAIHREWLSGFGSRLAAARAAHFFCEMYVRLKVVGLVEGLSFQLPITQAVLAEILGLSVVHTNRAVQRLRADGLISWEGPHISIRSWDNLQAYCEFDITYLHLENAPR